MKKMFISNRGNRSYNFKPKFKSFLEPHELLNKKKLEPNELFDG